MADLDDELADDLPAGGGSNRMMLAGAAVAAFLVGIGAGFAGNMFINNSEAASESSEEQAMDGEGTSAARTVAPLDPFIVNLRGSGGGRILRLEVQLEFDATDLDRITEGTPAMRDALLSLASDYSYGELEGIDGKMHFRDELLGRLNRVLEGPRIHRIYFTEFVVQ